MKHYTVGYADTPVLKHFQSFKVFNVEAPTVAQAIMAWRSAHPGTHMMFAQERQQRPSRFNVGDIIIDRGWDSLERRFVQQPKRVQVRDVSEDGTSYVVEPLHAHEPLPYRLYDDEVAPCLRVIGT